MQVVRSTLRHLEFSNCVVLLQYATIAVSTLHTVLKAITVRTIWET